MKSNSTPFHTTTVKTDAPTAGRERSASAVPNVPLTSPPLLSTLPSYAAYYEELARQYALPLSNAQWDPTETAALAALRAEFLASQKARGLGAATPIAVTRKLAALGSESAVFRRQVTSAFRRLVHQGTTGIEPRFLKLGLINKSPFDTIAWLASAQGAVEAVRPQLQRVLGFDASQRLAKLLSAMVDAVAFRENARARLIAMTAQTQSIALEIGKRVASLKTVARIAFADQPEVLRQFRSPMRKSSTRAASAPSALALPAGSTACGAANEDIDSSMRSEHAA